LQYNILMAADIAINTGILLAGGIAIQYIVGGRYCNQYIDWLHILQYNILVVADIAINILMAKDIAIQCIARHRYCNKYIGRSQKHQYNNNIYYYCAHPSSKCQYGMCLPIRTYSGCIDTKWAGRRVVDWLGCASNDLLRLNKAWIA
jgi:Na+(H+)/acetate symporter ActP